MNSQHLKIAAWCGPLFLTLFGLGAAPLANFIPPHSPEATAQAIAQIYQQNALSIQLGLVLMMISMAFLVPFTSVIYTQIRPLEGEKNVLSLTFLIAGTVIITLIYIVLSFWAVAAFRPDRAIEITQAFSDWAWLAFIWITSILLVLYIPVGLLVLSDKSSQPLFPRWYGFYCFWVALLTFPGAFLILFKTGPFAWDGLIAFWVPLFNFFPWYFVTFIVVLKSINKQAQ